MSSVEITFTTRRMPHSTGIHRITRAPEQLYYLLLFSTAPAYAGDASAWRSWIQMGFSLGLKDGPPGAARPDRLTRSVAPEARRLTVRLESANGDALLGVVRIVQAAEQARAAVTGTGEEARGIALAARPEVASLLTRQVAAALEKAGLRPDETQTLMGVLHRALGALADEDVTSVVVAQPTAV